MKRIKLQKKHKNKDSNRWLNRHLNDEYVRKSKVDGYRSRSSYKLIQINEKYDFLKNSFKIVDLGCSPGGWLQVVNKFSPKSSKIIGFDLIDLKSIPDIKFCKIDVNESEIFEEIDFFF